MKRQAKIFLSRMLLLLFVGHLLLCFIFSQANFIVQEFQKEWHLFFNSTTTQLSFLPSEFVQLEWVKDKKEFIYQGIMYDVKTISHQPKEIIIIAYCDKAEYVISQLFSKNNGNVIVNSPSFQLFYFFEKINESHTHTHAAIDTHTNKFIANIKKGFRAQVFRPPAFEA
ncbi:MAG: hypothetical protein RIQ89_2259 [Bacteroidota bacterium]|jgi:hypothetical protein